MGGVAFYNTYLVDYYIMSKMGVNLPYKLEFVVENVFDCFAVKDRGKTLVFPRAPLALYWRFAALRAE